MEKLHGKVNKRKGYNVEGKKLGIKILSVITDFLWAIPFLSVLSTVFIVNCKLANGVVSGKYFWFYGSMGLITITTLIQSFIPSIPQSFKFSKTDLFVFLFAGSVFFSAWMNGDTSTNTTKLALLALLLVLYLSVRITTPRPLKGELVQHTCSLCTVKSPLGDLGVAFIIITGFVEAVWGLLQLYGYKPSQHALFKLTGSFFNPGPYAGYLAVVFPLALHYLVNNGTRMRRIHADLKFLSAPIRVIRVIGVPLIAGVTCIAIILVLPAAMSRASWLAAIAGSAVVVFQSKWLPIRLIFGRWRIKSAMTTSIVVLLLLATITGLYYLKKNSADGRLLTWKVSLTVLAKHPFGVGLGHFPSAYGDAQAAYFASGKASETEEYVAGNPEYGFNEFLQIAVESGIISLLMFIGMLFFAFQGFIRHCGRDPQSPDRPLGAIGSLVALLVFACFSYPFSVLPFLIVFVFLLAKSTHPSPLKGEQDSESVPNTAVKSPLGDLGVKLWVKRAISVICVISVLLILYKQYPVFKAYKQWNSSRMYYQVGMYKDAVQNYEPLYPYLNDQIQFLFEYGRSLSQSEQPEKSNEVLQQAAKISCDPMLYNIMGKNCQAMKEYDKAEEYLLKSTHIVPNRLYPFYLLMKLYIETGDEKKARETAGIVLTKEPKVQSQAVREMREEARKITN